MYSISNADNNIVVADDVVVDVALRLILLPDVTAARFVVVGFGVKGELWSPPPTSDREID